MKKLYNIPCYDLNENLRSYHSIGNILAFKGRICFAKELLTGYFGIEILTEKMLDYENSTIRLIPGNTLSEKKERINAGLFVRKEDFIPKNIATKEDIDKYVDEYDKSEYKRLYNKLKKTTKGYQTELNQKIKTLRNKEK